MHDTARVQVQESPRDLPGGPQQSPPGKSQTPHSIGHENLLVDRILQGAAIAVLLDDKYHHLVRLRLRARATQGMEQSLVACSNAGLVQADMGKGQWFSMRETNFYRKMAVRGFFPSLSWGLTLQLIPESAK